MSKIDEMGNILDINLDFSAVSSQLYNVSSLGLGLLTGTAKREGNIYNVKKESESLQNRYFLDNLVNDSISYGEQFENASEITSRKVGGCFTINAISFKALPAKTTTKKKKRTRKGGRRPWWLPVPIRVAPIRTAGISRPSVRRVGLVPLPMGILALLQLFTGRFRRFALPIGRRRKKPKKKKPKTTTTTTTTTPEPEAEEIRRRRNGKRKAG